MLHSINPENYEESEAVAQAWLESTGAIVESTAYHKVCGEEIQAILGGDGPGGRRSPTAQVMRTRSDRLYVHKTKPVEFFVEIKEKSERWGNLALEIVPLANHLSSYRAMNTETLYAVVDLASDVWPGFWIQDLPPIKKAFIHDHHEDEERVYTTGLAESYLNPVFTDPHTRRSGSGDDFITIEAFNLAKLKDWRTLVLDRLGVDNGGRAV